MTQQRSRGQVLVLFAIFLTALLAFVALGVDGADVLVQERSTQSAADLAALAAVPSLESGSAGHAAALTAACTTATDNGYNDGSCGAGGSLVKVNNPYNGDDYKVEVIIRQPVKTFFLQVVGKSSITVQGRAVGTAHGFSLASPYVLMTMQPDEAGAFYLNNGSQMTVTGGTAGQTGGVYVASLGDANAEGGAPSGCGTNEGLCVGSGTSLTTTLIDVGASSYQCTGTCSPTPTHKAQCVLTTSSQTCDPLCPQDVHLGDSGWPQGNSPVNHSDWPKPWTSATTSTADAAGTCMTPPIPTTYSSTQSTGYASLGQGTSASCTTGSGPYLDTTPAATPANPDAHTLYPGCYKNDMVMNDGQTWTMYPGVYTLNGNGPTIGSPSGGSSSTSASINPSAVHSSAFTENPGGADHITIYNANSSCTDSANYVKATVNNTTETYDVPLTTIPDGATITGIDVSACVRKEGQNSAIKLVAGINGGALSSSGNVNVNSTTPATVSASLTPSSATKTSGMLAQIGVTLAQNQPIRIENISAVIHYTVAGTGTVVRMVPGTYVFVMGSGSEALDVCETKTCGSSNQGILTMLNSNDTSPSCSTCTATCTVSGTTSANLNTHDPRTPSPNYSPCNGTGALIYFTCTGYSASNLEPCITNQHNDPAVITGPNSIINLVSYNYCDAIHTDHNAVPCQDMSFWTDRTMNEESHVKFSGGTAYVSGIMYAPGQEFQHGGCGSTLNLTGQVIVGAINLRDEACHGASSPGQTWNVSYDVTQVAQSVGGYSLTE